MGKGSAAASIQAVKASIREAIVKLTDDKGLEREPAAQPVPPAAERTVRAAAKPKTNRLVS
jgi:hypothetical protein